MQKKKKGSGVTYKNHQKGSPCPWALDQKRDTQKQKRFEGGGGGGRGNKLMYLSL